MDLRQNRPSEVLRSIPLSHPKLSAFDLWRTEWPVHWSKQNQQNETYVGTWWCGFLIFVLDLQALFLQTNSLHFLLPGSGCSISGANASWGRRVSKKERSGWQRVIQHIKRSSFTTYSHDLSMKKHSTVKLGRPITCDHRPLSLR